MKFLYLGLARSWEQPSGWVQRILDQVNGVSQLGNEAHYAYLQDDALIFHNLDGEEQYFLPQKQGKCNKALSEIFCRLLEANQYDYVYLCGLLVDQTLLDVAVCAKTKCFGAKVIFEPIRYPHRPFCKQLLQTFQEKKEKELYRAVRQRMFDHRRLLARFSRQVDAVAVFGLPAEEAFGIPAIAVENGINIGNVQCRRCEEVHGDPISILGIVENPRTCGYDRIFQGLMDYRLNVHRDIVTFDIVGDNAAVAGLKELVKKNQLEDMVHFLGEKNSQEMANLFNTHSVAVAALGMYRAGQTYSSPTISKEYCAAGIPFIYACEEFSLDESIPFALKLVNNDSPINISLVGEFVWRCRLDRRLIQNERKFAEKYYDWRIIMKRILEFTATGKRVS